MDGRALLPDRPILVVAGDSALRFAFGRSLARYQTHSVATAGEALDRLSAGEPIAAAVIDIGLPDMSGLELLERIRAGRTNLPVVVLTDQLDRENINRAARLGAWCLCKPVAAVEVEEVVGQALRFEPHTPRIDVSALIAKHGLSRRESEVLTLALEGLRRDVIRTRLGIRETTVKKTVARLLRKCGAASLREIETNLQHWRAPANDHAA
jgi:two-component system nitrate/nitrite response regulator NarL